MYIYIHILGRKPHTRTYTHVSNALHIRHYHTRAIHTYIHIYTYMHAYIHTYMHGYIYLHIYRYIDLSIYLSICIYIYF